MGSGDVRRDLLEGRGSVPGVGAVIDGWSVQLPFLVVDGDGTELEPVSAYLRDVMLGIPAYRDIAAATLAAPGDLHDR